MISRIRLFTSSFSSCVAAGIIAASVATVDIIHDRRTVGEYIDDNTIELTARNIINKDKQVRKSTHIKSVSWNGILLITGEIENEEIKQQLVNELAKIKGVRQVVDETNILGKSKLSTRSRDAWISSKVKSKLIAKTGLDANRVKVVTTRKSVYLMGIVTRAEAERATDTARSVKGVERVVKVFEYTESEN